MSDGIEALKAAYVSQMQRAYHSSTRGIATPEDCQQWEADADRVIREVKAEVWETAYRQGVEDERLGEVLQVDVGVGVPAQAARQNPYRGGQ